MAAAACFTGAGRRCAGARAGIGCKAAGEAGCVVVGGLGAGLRDQARGGGTRGRLGLGLGWIRVVGAGGCD